MELKTSEEIQVIHDDLKEKFLTQLSEAKLRVGGDFAFTRTSLNKCFTQQTKRLQEKLKTVSVIEKEFTNKISKLERNTINNLNKGTLTYVKTLRKYDTETMKITDGDPLEQTFRQVLLKRIEKLLKIYEKLTL